MRRAACPAPLRCIRIGALLFLAAAALAWVIWRRYAPLFLTSVGVPGFRYAGLCAAYALLMIGGSLTAFRSRARVLPLLLSAAGSVMLFYRIFPQASAAAAALLLVVSLLCVCIVKKRSFGLTARQRALIAQYLRTQPE